MRPVSTASFSFAAMLLGLCNAPASAQIVETSSISNSWSWTVGGALGSPTLSGSGSNNGGSFEYGRDLVQDAYQSSLQFSMEGTLADDGQFYFLSNAACVGNCTVELTTQLTFNLTNLGSSAVDVRFDSLLTPGHLVNYGNQLGGATFDFSIVRDPGLPSELSAYSAYGIAGQDPETGMAFQISNSTGQDFNGLDIQSGIGGAEIRLADWSPTNINALLGVLAPNESRTIVYTSTVRIASEGYCPSFYPSFSSCGAYQVAFGDPRDQGTGGVNNIGDGSLSPFASAESTSGVSPVGLPMTRYGSRLSFVDADTTPLPEEPEVIGPIDYSEAPPTYTRFTPSVPEPATWLMLILGFGVIGGALRARRGGVVSGRAIAAH